MSHVACRKLHFSNDKHFLRVADRKLSTKTKSRDFLSGSIVVDQIRANRAASRAASAKSRGPGSMSAAAASAARGGEGGEGAAGRLAPEQAMHGTEHTAGIGSLTEA